MRHLTQAPVTIQDLRKIARMAGSAVREHFQPFGIDRVVKDDQTPVTKADLQSNRIVIDEVRRRSSIIDIVGEEESARTNSLWQLVCDPIDGTFPFTWGMPHFTVMIGLLYTGQPIMGVIHDPIMNRTYSAQKGRGAFMDGRRIQVSRAHRREDRPVVGYVSWPGCRYNILSVCQELEKAGVTLVNFCSIGYMEVAVGTGEFAGTIFPGTKNHDTVPGQVIVEEAGGKVTDIFGNAFDHRNEEMSGHVMSNGFIHDLLTSAVRNNNK